MRACAACVMLRRSCFLCKLGEDSFHRLQLPALQLLPMMAVCCELRRMAFIVKSLRCSCADCARICES